MTDTRFMSKEFLTKFIDIYKRHTALWKTKSKEYTNKNLKQKGYMELVEYCKTMYPDANRDFVVKKIQNMRGCFRKELKKVDSSQRSGAGTEDIYEPTLWYFDLLSFTKEQEIPITSIETAEFLYSHVQHELPEEIADKAKEDESEVQMESTPTQEFRKPPTPKKRSISPTSESPSKKSKKLKQQQQHQLQQQNQFLKSCTEILQQKDIPDECDAIGINVTAKLRKMEPMQQILAEGLIHKILKRGIFNELTRSTTLTNFKEKTFLNTQQSTSLSSELTKNHSGNDNSSSSATSESSPADSQLTDYYYTFSYD